MLIIIGRMITLVTIALLRLLPRSLKLVDTSTDSSTFLDPITKFMPLTHLVGLFSLTWKLVASNQRSLHPTQLHASPTMVVTAKVYVTTLRRVTSTMLPNLGNSSCND